MIFLNQNDHSNPIHLSFLFYYQRSYNQRLSDDKLKRDETTPKPVSTGSSGYGLRLQRKGGPVAG